MTMYHHHHHHISITIRVLTSQVMSQVDRQRIYPMFDVLNARTITVPILNKTKENKIKRMKPEWAR